MTDSWQVGAVRITRVEEAVTPIPAVALIPSFEPSMLAAHPWLQPRWFDEEGLLKLSVHTFVVQSGETSIVVDTCVGPEPERALPSDPAFLDRLDAAVDGGIEAVDVVLCTHLHFDHVGWNTVVRNGRRVATFPNARYLFGRVELEHLDVDDHMEVRDPAVQPLLDAGLVDTVETDHRITDEVSLVPTPGHTPGHVSVLIESEGATALITGDAIHTPLQIADPDIPAANFDWDSEMSCRTRHELIRAHANGTTLVLGTHFAPPSAGHIRTEGDRIWFEA
ncbi:MAG: MBL fold metallo-hydrolase [Actinomycetota bacterium]